MFKACDRFNEFMAEKVWPFRLKNYLLSFDDLYFTSTLIDIYMLCLEVKGDSGLSWVSFMDELAEALFRISLDGSAGHYDVPFIPPLPLPSPGTSRSASPEASSDNDIEPESSDESESDELASIGERFPDFLFFTYGRPK